MSNGGHEDDKSGLPRDLTRKIITLGLGAYFLTEDTVRRYVKDAKIPRDVGKLITQNASKGKEELYGFVARELSGFLKQMDLQQELDRFLGSHKIRINAEVEFVPRPKPASADEDEAEAEGGEPADEGPVEWNVTFRQGQPEGEELEEGEA